MFKCSDRQTYTWHTPGQEDATDILPFRKRGWQQFIICLFDRNFVCFFNFFCSRCHRPRVEGPAWPPVLTPALNVISKYRNTYACLLIQ